MSGWRCTALWMEIHGPIGVFIPGRPEPGPNDDNDGLLDRVSPNFFAAVGQPVIRGRGLNGGHRPTHSFVAVSEPGLRKEVFPQ